MQNRDTIPDIATRERRMPDLLATPALPIADVALYLDVPMSTLDLLRARGQGPKCFKIGRRLYVLQSELRAWLEKMALEAAV